MPNARMEAVNVLNQRMVKLTLSPDWKWLKNIKTIVGTHNCQATHTDIIAEGAVHCVCDDGAKRHTRLAMHMRFQQVTTRGFLGTNRP